MVAPATVGFLELLVFFFATRLRETAFFAGFRFAVVLRFIVRFLAGDFFLATRFLETAFFAGFRLAVVLRFIVRFLEMAFFAVFRLAVVLRFIVRFLAGDFFFSVRFLATIFFAAFFTVLGFLVVAFERLDVVLLVAISHLNYFLLHIRTGGKYTKCTASSR